MPINLTASAVPLARPCELLGFYVNSTSTGTIVFHDSASASTNNAISGTITPAIGYHPFPASLGSGLRVVIANTINVTLFVKPIG
jgi:hypothetical protein